MANKTNLLWKGFWQLADPKIWIASTVPMILSVALAYSEYKGFNIYWFILSLAGVYLIETGKNAVNEYVDYKSGVDRFVTEDKRTPFSGGKKTIVDGVLELNHTKNIGIATMAAAGIIGLYITLAREPKVFWIGAAGFLISIIYSLPPIKLAYRGFGELAVGFVYGPLLMSGSYLVQTHTLSLVTALASLPVGFLIANVLVINEFPDYEADLKGYKRNLVVRLGKKNSVTVYALLYILAYTGVMALMIVTRKFSWAIALTSIPMAMSSVKVAQKYYDDIPRLVEANAKTILVYIWTGLALSLGALF